MIEENIIKIQANDDQYKLLCSEKKAAKNLCVNPECLVLSPMCQFRHCRCRSQHQCCSFIEISGLLKHFQMKKQMMRTIIGCIEKLYKDMIQSIKNKKQQTINFYLRNHGLRQNEKYLYSKIMKGGQHKINGYFVRKIHQQITEQLPKIAIQQEQAYIREIWQKQKEKLQKFYKTVDNFIYKSSFNFERMDTSTLISSQDKQALRRFFQPNKIKNFELLYRASLQNFKVHKFHEKCDGVNDTVVIIRTYKDKIIGGYTKIPWDKQKIPRQDTKRQNFVFSINEKMIFYLQSEQGKGCITGVPKKGPIFGNEDIQICDQAHKDEESKFRIGNIYQNKFYLTNSKEGNQMFCGSKNGKIRVKEWEVFKVNFIK